MTREYSSISVETTLNSGINTTATTMTVPSIPAATALLGGVGLAPGNVDIFTVAIDPDTVNEEIVYITGVSGDTFTISRGQADTGNAGVSGIAHNAGASIKHVMTSDDLNFFKTAIQPDTLTAKGDIYAASASATVGRVAVGTNGQVLTADSAQTRGLAWSTVAVTPRIGQVVQTTTATSTITASTSYVDATGITATITPTLNTSKILVTVNTTVAADGNFNLAPNVQTQVLRGATSIIDSGAIVIYTNVSQTASFFSQRISLVYLDSPATTSATTYKLQVKKGNGTSGTAGYAGTSTVTLQEVLV
jgi:trimeric autotransporter adhesin